MVNAGTDQNICVTEAMLVPSGGVSPRSGEGPSQSLGALVASAVRRWALGKLHDASAHGVTIFTDENALKTYISGIRKLNLGFLEVPDELFSRECLAGAGT